MVEISKNLRIGLYIVTYDFDKTKFIVTHKYDLVEPREFTFFIDAARYLAETRDMKDDAALGYVEGLIDVWLCNGLGFNIKYVLDILRQTREIVKDGAMVGFNPHEGGEWASQLYVNNGALTNAIKRLEENS